jgi:hypothetical protein
MDIDKATDEKKIVHHLTAEPLVVTKPILIQQNTEENEGDN